MGDRDRGVRAAPQQLAVQLEAHQKHVEHDAQLRDDVEEGRHVWRQDVRRQPGSHTAEK